MLDILTKPFFNIVGHMNQTISSFTCHKIKSSATSLGFMSFLMISTRFFLVYLCFQLARVFSIISNLNKIKVEVGNLLFSQKDIQKKRKETTKHTQNEQANMYQLSSIPVFNN